eukprot:c25736_g1_i1 orf=168-1478(+)
MMRMMMMKAWRGSLLLLLLLSFSCGGVASASSSATAKEDEPVTSVFDSVSELVQKISAARDWDLSQVHILNIDSENVKYTKATIYELDIQIGDQILPAKFIDDVTDWQHLGVLEADSGDSRTEKGTEDASWNLKTLQSVLIPFRLNGPLDLLFKSSETSQGSSERGEDLADFKAVKLAVGSSVEVSGAQEVSLAHPVELSLPVNRSSPVRSLAASILLLADRTKNHGLQYEDDASRLSLHITGPTLVASITGFDSPLHQPEEDLNFGSVKVLYEESEHDYEQAPPPTPESTMRNEKGSIWPFPILNSSDPRMSVLEEMLKAYMEYSSYKQSFTILHAKVAASTFVLFEFEIERKLNTEDFEPEDWPEWKTRPSVKKYSFQVLAKVQDNTLIPITVQSLKRHKAVETYAWRELTSNMSYTSYSTYLGLPSPMTLDVY